MCICQSQSPGLFLPHFSPWSQYLFSTSVAVLLFCKEVHFLDSAYKWYFTCLSLTSLRSKDFKMKKRADVVNSAFLLTLTWGNRGPRGKEAHQGVWRPLLSEGAEGPQLWSAGLGPDPALPTDTNSSTSLIPYLRGDLIWDGRAQPKAWLLITGLLRQLCLRVNLTAS